MLPFCALDQTATQPVGRPTELSLDRLKKDSPGSRRPIAHRPGLEYAISTELSGTLNRLEPGLIGPQSGADSRSCRHPNQIFPARFSAPSVHATALSSTRSRRIEGTAQRKARPMLHKSG